MPSWRESTTVVILSKESAFLILTAVVIIPFIDVREEIQVILFNHFLTTHMSLVLFYSCYSWFVIQINVLEMILRRE